MELCSRGSDSSVTAITHRNAVRIPPPSRGSHSRFPQPSTNKNPNSCDEQPLLRIPEGASLLHARGLSQPVLHHPSPEGLSA